MDGLMFVCMYLYLCIYVSMHLCMYVCMYVRIYVCMRVCMHVCMHACIYVCMHACMYVCVRLCVCVSVYLCARIDVCVCASAHVVWMDVYVYVYVCISCVTLENTSFQHVILHGLQPYRVTLLFFHFFPASKLRRRIFFCFLCLLFLCLAGCKLQTLCHSLPLGKHLNPCRCV